LTILLLLYVVNLLPIIDVTRLVIYYLWIIACQIIVEKLQVNLQKLRRPIIHDTISLIVLLLWPDLLWTMMIKSTVHHLPWIGRISICMKSVRIFRWYVSRTFDSSYFAIHWSSCWHL